MHIRTMIVAAAMTMPAAAIADAMIDKGAVEPYAQKAYPKTFARWKKAGVAKIDQFRSLAATRASKSPKCDYVEAADLSDNRSSPPDRIVIFVDCRNGERFYFTSAELSADGPAYTQSEKTKFITDEFALRSCEDAIRTQMKFPSAMRKSRFTSNVYRAPTTGNVVATFEFTAKNGLGLDLPQSARCVFDDRGMHEPEITNR